MTATGWPPTATLSDGGEQPSELRVLPQRREVLARDQLHVAAGADRLAAGLQLHAGDARRREQLAGRARRQLVARMLEHRR